MKNRTATARSTSRRAFMKTAAAAGAGLLILPTGARVGAAAPSNKLNVALIGAYGRALAHYDPIASENVVALCDVNEDHIAIAAERFPNAKHYVDWRQCLEQKDLDAIICCTTDHTHAFVATWAMNRGLHVYCEKPLANSVAEARLVRETYLKNKDKIATQCGMQRHAHENFNRVSELIRDGAIGELEEVHAWGNRQIPKPGYLPAQGEPPRNLHYDLWLGPAPRRPFNPNRFHYNWRWFWDYAGGKCADWGIHLMDMIHWGMGVDAPMAASSEGSRRALDDNCETPDTQMVLFEYPGFICTWEHREANAYPVDGYGHGMAFYGTKGTLLMDRSGWKVLSEGQSIPEPPSGSGSDGQMYVDHAAHFLECIRTRQTPRSDIEIAHRTTSALHLGNIAYRVKRRVVWDRERETIVGDDEACELLGREYRKPWELPRV